MSKHTERPKFQHNQISQSTHSENISQEKKNLKNPANLAENMGAGMPEGIAAFVGVEGEELELTISLQRPRHVPQSSVDLRDQRIRRQAFRNLLRHVKRRGPPSLALLHRTVRQLNPGKDHARKTAIRDLARSSIMELGFLPDRIGGERLEVSELLSFD